MIARLAIVAVCVVLLALVLVPAAPLRKRLDEARLRRWMRDTSNDWQTVWTFPNNAYIVLSDLGPAMENPDHRYEVEVSWGPRSRVDLVYFPRKWRAMQFIGWVRRIGPTENVPKYLDAAARRKGGGPLV